MSQNTDIGVSVLACDTGGPVDMLLSSCVCIVCGSTRVNMAVHMFNACDPVCVPVHMAGRVEECGFVLIRVTGFACVMWRTAATRMRQEFGKDMW